MELRNWTVAKLVVIGVAVLSIAAPTAVAQTSQGNVVTETTTLPNGFVKVEVTVTNPATGQLVSKTETIVANGQVVKMETVTISNGQLVKVEQEFRLIGDQLVKVKEEREVKKAQEAEGEIKILAGEHQGGGEQEHGAEHGGTPEH
jgi:hypothetical protein